MSIFTYIRNHLPSINSWLGIIAVGILTAIPAHAQLPSACASLNTRSNGNGQSTSCPNVSGTAYATNFHGTSYATVPSGAKSGNITFSYTGIIPTFLPYAITKVWATSAGVSTIQPIQFGPAGVPTTSGGNTIVSYCYYSNNLPNSGILSFQLTDPITGIVWGVCSFDASCNSNCSVVSNPTTLPVKFEYFTGQAQPDGAVQLKWATAQEFNNKGFAVERSADSNFTEIAFVPSENPGGISALPTYYSYVDPTAPAATHITYRLKQIDLDGNPSYSQVVALQGSATHSGVRIYAAGSHVIVTIPGSGTTSPFDILVYDTQGRTIRHVSNSITGTAVVNGLPERSVYYVSVLQDNGQTRTVKSVYIP